MPDFLQSCPNCGGAPALKKAKGRFYYECDGDCWTQTHKHSNGQDAAAEWNSLKPTPKEESNNAT